MFRSILPQRAALIRFLFVAAPKVLLGAGTVGLNLLLLRYMGAEQFAVLSLCITAILMTDSIAGSAFDYTVLKLAPVAGAEEPLFHAAAFQVKALVALVLLACSLLFAGPVDRTFFQGAAGPAAIAVTAAAAGAVLLLRSAQTWLQSRQDFRTYGAFDLIHLCLRFGGVGLLALSGRISPVSAMLVFLTAAALPLAIWAVRNAKVVPLFHSRTDLRWRVVRDAKWMLLTFAAGALISRLDLALVAHYAGLREAGFYSAAQVLAMTIQLAGIYLSVVLTPRISPLVESGEFRTFFRNAQTGVVALAGLAFVVVLLARPLLTGVLLPATYSHSADIVYMLVPGALAGFTMFPLTIGYLMFVRPRFLFTMDCISVPVLIAGAAVLVPHYGAIGAAALSSAIHLTRAGISTVAAWRSSSVATQDVPLRQSRKPAVALS